MLCVDCGAVVFRCSEVVGDDPVPEEEVPEGVRERCEEIYLDADSPLVAQCPGVDKYLRACVIDLTSLGEQPEKMRKALCENLEATVEECADHGFPVQDWRAPTDCGMRLHHLPHLKAGLRGLAESSLAVGKMGYISKNET